jgi:hypothetical protein
MKARGGAQLIHRHQESTLRFYSCDPPNTRLVIVALSVFVDRERDVMNRLFD